MGVHINTYYIIGSCAIYSGTTEGKVANPHYLGPAPARPSFVDLWIDWGTKTTGGSHRFGWRKPFSSHAIRFQSLIFIFSIDIMAKRFYLLIVVVGGGLTTPSVLLKSMKCRMAGLFASLWPFSYSSCGSTRLFGPQTFMEHWYSHPMRPQDGMLIELPRS